ncbi:hypothetical protein A1O3_02487 [Capronia epimyces CBS 606.96]|uniref:Putative lipase ATG15 n=1 Tax=Capronia epimyces CBS 606.96 TaxID=1182542 RepID=W9YIE3_9EURO|nr:uncharacterized protein A1O3_02487 [Capronia epimyces CBS 606.96]EXJ89420.1 hypothetical protein A1O3_02487 [Capronia epimyces CBS 606.96]
MPRQVCNLAVLLASLAAFLVIFTRTGQVQHPFGDDLAPLGFDESQRSAPSRSYFSLQYAFMYDTEDVEAPATFMDASSLSKTSGYADTAGIRRPEPFPVLARTWGENDNQQGTFDTDDIPQPLGPDVTDRDTIISLAMMTSDAYVFGPSEPDWLNSTNGFNHSVGFGWNGTGLRGHIFANADNGTVIISFKGTSLDPRDKWRANDRLNDNLLFSCCCGDQRPDPYPYGPVCDCRTDIYQCNSTCLTQELCQNDRYYGSALTVISDVLTWYPDAIVWSIGHSLGGAVASLIGLTHNFPTVTFEAPPEKLPAYRLGLLYSRKPMTYHFGNTADPVFMGACNGWSSSCGLAGYAFESQCFTGKKCVYDTVGDLGWRLSIANHRINTVIKDVLQKYNTTPTCEFDDECVDCYNWDFTVPSAKPSSESKRSF